MVFSISSLEKFRHKGKKHPKGIRVCQYTLQGELIRCFADSVDAGQVTKIVHKNIREVARGNRKSAGGFFWSYCPKEK